MRVEDIVTLYDYNYWANERCLEEAARVSQEQFVAPVITTRSIRGALVHQLDVEWSWRLRWQGRGEGEEMLEADFPSVDALAARWHEDEQEMRAYLANLSDIDVTRSFALPWGRPEPLWYSLVHVVNHGTQQRGDAAVLLTHYGHSPGNLDFRDFTQQRLAADAN